MSKISDTLHSNSIRFRKWFAFALVLKFVFIVYILFQVHESSIYQKRLLNFIVFKSADHNYFVKPGENYFKFGVMSLSESGSKAFAGRMPGYTFPYIALRYIFPEQWALSILIILQILLSGISIYWISKSVFDFYGNKNMFYYSFFIYAFANVTTGLDLQTMTESFAVSCVCGMIYYLVKYFKMSNRPLDLVLAGFFACWAIFLRPFMGVIVFFVPLFILIHQLKNRNGFFIISKQIALFLICFMVAETAWISRNFLVMNKFIPLESKFSEAYGKSYAEPWLAIRNLSAAMGEGAAYFEKNSLAAWFRGYNEPSKNPYYQFKKDRLLEMSFNNDSLLWLKEQYLIYKNSNDTLLDRKLFHIVVAAANRYKSEYESKHQLQTWIINPIQNLKAYLISSGSGYLMLNNSSGFKWHHLLLKLTVAIMYYLILLSGLWALWMMLFHFRKYDFLQQTFTLIIITNIVFITLVSVIQENRYLMPVIPLLLFIGVEKLNLFFERFNKWKQMS